jgi:type II secretory pathway component PulF
MSTTERDRPGVGFGVAGVGTVVLAVLVLVLFGMLVFYVPGAKKTFDEFGMTLPWATQSTIRASNWVAEYWWCAAPVVLLALGGNFALLDSLGRRDRVVPTLLVAAETLWLGAMVALVAVSILLPMAKLHEGLAR